MEKREVNKQRLQEEGTQILMGIEEWRRANPKATFLEIEEEVHKRMLQLEALLMQEATKARQSRIQGKGAEHEAAQTADGEPESKGQ